MNNLRTVKAFGNLSRLISVSVLMGCAGGAVSSSANDPSHGSMREQVLSCYDREYRRQHDGAPTIDDKERQTADQLIERYNYRAKRVCDLIRSAMSGKLCGLPPKLASVAACDEQSGRQRDDLNPADKAQMDTRVRNRENFPGTPGMDR